MEPCPLVPPPRGPPPDPTPPDPPERPDLPPEPPDFPPEPPDFPPDPPPDPPPPEPPPPLGLGWGLLTAEKLADPLYPEAVTSFGTTVTVYVPLGLEIVTASEVDELCAELPALDTYRSKLSLEDPQWIDTVAWPSWSVQ